MKQLCIPAPEYFPAISRLYRQWGEKVKCGKLDWVYTLKDGDAVVAAARIVEPGEGAFLLRNLTVEPALRRQGLARRLMREILTRPEGFNLYCYALAYLEPFYASLGFETRDCTQVPECIAEPYRRYTNRGKRFILMQANPEESQGV